VNCFGYENEKYAVLAGPAIPGHMFGHGKSGFCGGKEIRIQALPDD
jgi:hypothetical protein